MRVNRPLVFKAVRAVKSALERIIFSDGAICLNNDNPEIRCPYALLIGKYLSSLRKLDDVITPKEGFET